MVAPSPLDAKLNAAYAPYTPLISPDGKTFYFTSVKGAFDELPPPMAPMSYSKFVEAIRAPGNGLGDIYEIAATPSLPSSRSTELSMHEETALIATIAGGWGSRSCSASSRSASAAAARRLPGGRRRRRAVHARLRRGRRTRARSSPRSASSC